MLHLFVRWQKQLVCWNTFVIFCYRSDKRLYEIHILGQLLSVIFLDNLSLFYNYATVNIFKEVYLVHVEYGKIFLHSLVRNKSDELV